MSNDDAFLDSTPILSEAELAAAESAVAVNANEMVVAELRDRLLRLQAEFENFRKIKVREGEKIRAFATTALLEEMLPVLDHLELALSPTLDRTDPKWGKGIDLIARQLLETLKGFGLEEIDVARHKKFDPDLHQAVAHEEDIEVEAGRVVRVIRKGYRLRDRLLRASHVTVAAGAKDDVETIDASTTNSSSGTSDVNGREEKD